MLPLNGWLVDRLGAKRLYLGCFSAFTLASLLCGAARTMDELICARMLQGIAGGLLAPMTQMMIARVAGKHLARVMGYTVAPVLIAPILGPILAGAILKYAAWPWLFYLNLPIGILGVGLATFLLPGEALLALLAVLPFLWMIQNQFSPALTVMSLLVAGAGQGTISIPSVSAAYASVPRDKLAVANTAINIVQRLGGPLATTVVAFVISLSASDFPASRPRPFMIAFVLLIGLHLLVLGSTSRLPVRIHPNTSEDVAGRLRRI